MKTDRKAVEVSIKKRAGEIDDILKSYLPAEEGLQKTVIEAMHYSVLAGGKRIRAMLMQETYRLCGGQGKIVEPFMAAMEMIHTYSLIHDDLPAMDNDEYRRGRKTTHVVFGEGMAVLAGDALLNYAFETALTSFSSCDAAGIPLVERYQMASAALIILAKKAGIYGMIGGQTADIEAETKKDITIDRLIFIHEHKTAALMEGSMMIGAILAGADTNTVDSMEKCAHNIGVAFQIQDDILDVIGNEEKIGKKVGSDEKNHKQTYVTMKGVKEAEKEVKRLSAEALAILMECPGDSQFLQELTKYLIHRNK
ncbi:MAG TPA: farnesyl diphosphate synthase [Lachnospiraceae bacterium]|nr:farnesyl diphosphate synthase [Lachnospiraceae bacterium]